MICHFITFKSQYNLFHNNGRRYHHLHSTQNMDYWNKFKKSINFNNFYKFIEKMYMTEM